MTIQEEMEDAARLLAVCESFNFGNVQRIIKEGTKLYIAKLQDDLDSGAQKIEEIHNNEE